MRSKTAAPEVLAPVVSEPTPVKEPERVLKIHAGGKVKSRRRSRPAPMMIKPRKSPFVAKQPSTKTVENKKTKARISVDALKQLLKKNASKKTDGVVMPDAKVMQQRARIRENQRISNDAKAKPASQSKRAA